VSRIFSGDPDSFAGSGSYSCNDRIKSFICIGQVAAAFSAKV